MVEHDKVAIIGCGYVGLALGSALVDAGCDVLGTTTTSAKLSQMAEAGIESACVVLAQVDELRSLLANRQLIYTCVAPNAQYDTYEAVYRDGMEHLFESLAGSQFRHLVHISSTSVYGQTAGQWVDETSPASPSTQNGRIVLSAEQLVMGAVAALGKTATILRLGGIVGPGRRPSRGAIASAGAERSDGDIWVNLIHRDDIVEACLALRSQPYDGILNLTCGSPITRRELYDQAISATRLDPIRWSGQDSAAQPTGKRVRSDLIKRILPYRPSHNHPWLNP